MNLFYTVSHKEKREYRMDHVLYDSWLFHTFFLCPPKKEGKKRIQSKCTKKILDFNLKNILQNCFDMLLRLLIFWDTQHNLACARVTKDVPFLSLSFFHFNWTKRRLVGVLIIMCIITMKIFKSQYVHNIYFFL